MTVLELLSASLRKIGILAAGEVLTADESSAALEALNVMVDEWSTERLSIYKRTRTELTITSGTGSYTIGSGGDVDIVWPVYLDDVRLIETSSGTDQERPLGHMTDDAWAATVEKTATSTDPGYWHYEKAYPLGVLNFWPVPTSDTLEAAVYTPTAVEEFDAVTDTLSLPPGYRSALILNLALRLSSDYKVALDAGLVTTAVNAKAAIQRVNERPSDLCLDSGALGQSAGTYFNIYTGQ
jgi:hypothetical protein